MLQQAIFVVLIQCIMVPCFQVQAARTAGESVAEYACQRVTLLHHRNNKFTVRIKAYDIS